MTPSPAVPILRSHLLALAGLVVGGVLLALLASSGCGNTFFDDAQPSSYCQATHLPGLPDTLGSAALLAVIYLGPALVAGIGLLVARRTGGQRLVRLGLGLGLVLLILALVQTLGAANTVNSGPAF